MNPSQQQLERIVAYLDGELPAEESAQVEQQLAADEQFRQQLQGAERAWAALDQLPMASVADEFSRTTMDMVVDAARRKVEAKTIALPIQRRQRGTAIALLATMAVLLGAVVFRVAWQNPNRRLLADLPVVQHVDIYSQFRSVEFLQELDRRLSEAAPLDSAEGEQLQAKLAEFQFVSAVDNREDWLESLPADDKVSLRAKFNRFHELSIERQSELRELHRQIEAADNRGLLLRTMFRYQQWLNGLPQSKQFEYRNLPTSDHARGVASEMKQAASEHRFEMTAEQIQDVFRHVRPHIQKVVRKKQKVFDQNLSKMSPRERRHFQSLSKHEQAMRSYQLAIKDSPEQMREFIDVIAEALPSEMRDTFRQLPPWEKFNLSRSWFWRARSQPGNDRRSVAHRHSGNIPEQELADFFVELETDEKERLLALPREEMQRQLKRKYFGRGSRHDRLRRSDWDSRLPPGGPRPDGWRRDRRDQSGPPPRGLRGGPRFDGELDRRPPRGVE